MKRICLLILMGTSLGLNAQQYISVANRCFEEKQWLCAAENYTLGLQHKQHVEKDLALIQFRIGKSYVELKMYARAIPVLRDAVATNPIYGVALWNLAIAYYNTKDYTNAALNYGLAAAQFSADPKSQRTIYYWQGFSYSNLSKRTEAIQTLLKALALDSTTADANALIGDNYYNDGKYRDAVLHYSRCIRYTSDTAKHALSVYHEWRGFSYDKLADYPKAASDFSRAISLEPPRKNLQWELGRVYAKDLKYKDAVVEYGRAIGLYKGDAVSLARLYYQRGFAYEKQNEFAKADADYDESIRNNPDLYSPYWGKASVLYTRKKYKEAVPAFTRALEKSAIPTTDKATLHYLRGKSYLNLPDTNNAVKDFEAAVSADRYYTTPHQELGHISFARGLYGKAVTHYTTTLDDYFYFFGKQEEALIYTRRGISRVMLGYSASAKSDLGEAIKVDSLNATAYRYLGAIQYTEKNYSLAVSTFGKCIPLYQDNKDSLALVYGFRGQCYIDLKNNAAALADFEQASKIKPAETSYVFKVGQLAFELKEYAKAITQFTRTIGMLKPANKTELAYAHYCRGRSYLEAADKTNAKKDFTKALEYVPSYTDASTWLAKTQ